MRGYRYARTVVKIFKINPKYTYLTALEFARNAMIKQKGKSGDKMMTIKEANKRYWAIKLNAENVVNVALRAMISKEYHRAFILFNDALKLLIRINERRCGGAEICYDNMKYIRKLDPEAANID